MVGRILVIGGTGLLGEPVARRLRDAGYGVRVMARNPERARETFPPPFDVVAGDSLNQDEVQEAIDGCQAVHISVDHEREDTCAANAVRAAKILGVERITYVSGTTVCEENRWFPLVERKLRAEEAIRTGGIDYTIFCPGWFMEMLSRLVHDGRAMIFGRPTRRWHFVSVQDFARMVVEGYRRSEAVNKRFYIHGPEALTLPEALRAYCREMHPEIQTIHSMPYRMLRFIARLRGNAELRAGVDMVSYLESVGERGDPAEANAILGAPRIGLAQWLAVQRKSTLTAS